MVFKKSAFCKRKHFKCWEDKQYSYWLWELRENHKTAYFLSLSSSSPHFSYSVYILWNMIKHPSVEFIPSLFYPSFALEELSMLGVNGCPCWPGFTFKLSLISSGPLRLTVFHFSFIHAFHHLNNSFIASLLSSDL